VSIMPRIALVLSLSVAVLGCASAQSFQATAHPDGDPFACVTRQLANHEFTVTAAERDAGLIIAESRDDDAGGLFGWETYKILTFNILDDRTIRVLAKREIREGSSTRTVAIQDADDIAQGILGACGTLSG